MTPDNGTAICALKRDSFQSMAPRVLAGLVMKHALSQALLSKPA